ncbi:hypothetical protein HDZ31DRAFT_68713 [Schizophyllum fasciatum]
MRVVSQLNFRDIAHSTAGTLLKPKLGRTYSFREFFPAPSTFTFEDACRAHGFSAARTQFLASRSSSPGIFVRRRPRSPERISQYLPSSPAARIRDLTPSPDFPSLPLVPRSLPLPSPSVPSSSPPSSSPPAYAPEQDDIEASAIAALDQTVVYASPSPRFMPGSPQLPSSPSLSYVDEEEDDAAAVVMSSSEHASLPLPIAPSSPSSLISSLSYASEDSERAADIAAPCEVAVYAPTSPPFVPSSPRSSSPSSFEGDDLASNPAFDQVAAPALRSPSVVSSRPVSSLSSPWEHALEEEDCAEPAAGARGDVAATSDTEIDNHWASSSTMHPLSPQVGALEDLDSTSRPRYYKEGWVPSPPPARYLRPRHCVLPARDE